MITKTITGTVYVAEMSQLSETALMVFKEFMDRKHVIRNSDTTLFNSVWFDLGLEQSVVKDKTSRIGGIIGFSRNEVASAKWALTVHTRSAVVKNVKCMSGLNESEESIHRDLQQTKIAADEKSMVALMQVISDHNGNAFTIENAINCDIDVDERGPMINIFTGVVANDTFSMSFFSA